MRLLLTLVLFVMVGWYAPVGLVGATPIPATKIGDTIYALQPGAPVRWFLPGEEPQLEPHCFVTNDGFYRTATCAWDAVVGLTDGGVAVVAGGGESVEQKIRPEMVCLLFTFVAMILSLVMALAAKRFQQSGWAVTLIRFAGVCFGIGLLASIFAIAAMGTYALVASCAITCAALLIHRLIDDDYHCAVVLQGSAAVLCFAVLLHAQYG